MGPTVIVSGALANKYRNGGEAWVRLSWVRGLQRLGFDVHFVEQITPAACAGAAGRPAPFEQCANLSYFRDVTARFGLSDRATLVYVDDAPGRDPGGRPLTAGLPWDRLLDVAAAADLLVNISGHLTVAPVFDRVRWRAYVDIDPGFTQFWHADPALPFRVGGHDVYYTIGANVGAPNCPIPTGGIDWRHVRQPIVLDDWPVCPPPAGPLKFTTVASWRGAFGPVQHGGRTYGVKAHEFRKVLPLPRRVREANGAPARFEIALSIHPGDGQDRVALEDHGWRLEDPAAAAGDPDAFRRYVAGSGAEFSVAQGVYVDTNSGWFSDRTVRYLATGRPALVQDSGFGRDLPTGDGLVPFRDLDGAVEGARRIALDYEAHARAARALAESHFDSDKVLGRFVEEVGL